MASQLPRISSPTATRASERVAVWWTEHIAAGNALAVRTPGMLGEASGVHGVEDVLRARSAFFQGADLSPRLGAVRSPLLACAHSCSRLIGRMPALVRGAHLLPSRRAAPRFDNFGVIALMLRLIRELHQVARIIVRAVVVDVMNDLARLQQIFGVPCVPDKPSTRYSRSRYAPGLAKLWRYPSPPPPLHGVEPLALKARVRWASLFANRRPFPGVGSPPTGTIAVDVPVIVEGLPAVSARLQMTHMNIVYASNQVGAIS